MAKGGGGREREEKEWRGGNISRFVHFSVHAYRYFRGNRVPPFPIGPVPPLFLAQETTCFAVHTRINVDVD